ncbi:adenylyltransferase/cytidyltransferase family protein [Candidatus Tisiphia endosymbiont of Mystacides longicornis]|uniref:adenylyltransferase/cytidyltransferase family protein n=1 Tax=Candidatus Tisiphia endosymbiont of Mystacides longicornis TaxID=3139330 RepID=UPI003CCB1B25
MVEDNHTKIIYYNGTLLHKCSKNNQLVLVGGCFDLLHYGHIQFLRNAKAQGNYLIVALEPDETINNYKKREVIIISCNVQKF